MECLQMISGKDVKFGIVMRVFWFISISFALLLLATSRRQSAQAWWDGRCVLLLSLQGRASRRLSPPASRRRRRGRVHCLEVIVGVPGGPTRRGRSDGT